jgi:CRP/FNR family cyclic AMP-dependent transcriptional regulator
MFLKRRSDKVDALRNVPLLSDLSRTHLNRIATLASQRTEGAGKILAQQGTPGLEFFLILEGAARVERDGKLLARLVAGECFGEMSLVDNKLRSATVTAETAVVLLMIHTRSFHRLLDEVPGLQKKLLVALSERLREANAALAAMAGVGDKFGLYKAISEAGSVTPAKLAEITGIPWRHIRVWLSAQAAGDFLDYDEATGRYSLPSGGPRGPAAGHTYRGDAVRRFVN